VWLTAARCHLAASRCLAVMQGNNPVKAVTGHSTYKFGDITRAVLGGGRPPTPPRDAPDLLPHIDHEVPARGSGAEVAAVGGSSRGGGGGIPGSASAAASTTTPASGGGAAAGAGAGGGPSGGVSPASGGGSGASSHPKPSDSVDIAADVVPKRIWESFFNQACVTFRVCASRSMLPQLCCATLCCTTLNTVHFVTVFPSAMCARSYLVGEEAVRRGVVPADDVLEEAGYLYLGIPALTMLEGVLRSLSLTDAFQLAEGMVVNDAMCPADMRDLFTRLTTIKGAVVAARLEPAELASLRVLVLGVPTGDDAALQSRGVSAARLAELNAIKAMTHSVATDISRMAAYKSSFHNVLALLGAVLDSPDVK
jgi:hypothetical protein